MPQQPTTTPGIGDDVSYLFPVGSDVTALLAGTPAPEARGFLSRAVPMALRVGGAVVGGALGGVVGAAAGGIGAVPGAMAGGAAGSGLGEALAEGLEVQRGDRERISPAQVLTQTALGAIPVVGRAGATVARGVISRGAQGAGLGAVSTAATELAEGRRPTMSEVATGGALGALLGGPAGAVEAKIGQRIGRSVPPSRTPAPVAGDAALPRLGDDVTDLLGGPAASSRAIPRESDVIPPVSDAIPREYAATAGPISRVPRRGADIPPARPIPDRDLVSEQMAARIPDPEARKDVLRVIEENGGFAAARGGVQSDERIAALAKLIRFDADKALPAGQALNAAETQALANAYVTVTDRVTGLSKRIANTAQATDVDRLALAKAREEQIILIQSALGARAEAGRSLRNYRLLGEIWNSGDELAIKQAMKHPELRGLNSFAAQWAALPDDAAKLDFLKRHQKMSAFDIVHSFWINNVLSGAKTHLRNLIGTTANAAFRSASHVAATGYDVARSVTTGAPRTMYLGEYSPQAAGALLGIREGLDELLFVLKHGYARTRLQTFDTPRPELRGILAPFNAPGRLLESEDQFLGAVFRNAELWKRAYARARTEVGNDHDLIALKLANWKLKGFPKEIVAAAEKESLATLYRDEPGKFAQRIIDLKSEGGAIGKALSFVIPFVRVPASVLRQSVENLPGGAFATAQGRSALRAGGREQAEAVGRMVTGSTALGLLAYWASQGKVSGEGPSDPNERQALLEQGWRPRSVKIGDRWVSYEMAFQAIAAPLTAVSNAWEAYHAKGGSPDVVSMLSGLIRTPMDASFLSGLSDFTLAVSDPKRYGARFTGNLASGFVPFAGLLRNTSNTLDPVIRDPRSGGIATTALGQVQSIIPGLSESLPARLDRFGQPVTRDPGAGFSPISVSRTKDDVIIREMSRLGVNIGLPPRKLEPTRTSPEIILTNDERAAIGAEVRKALENLIGTGERIRQVDPELARRTVGRVVADARARAYGRIRAARRERSRQAAQ